MKLSSDLQNTTQKTKDWVTRNLQKHAGEKLPPLNATRRVTRVTHSVINHEWRQDGVCDNHKENISVVMCDTEIT
jgi:hypothetical protein